jgi:hypothetical protein
MDAGCVETARHAYAKHLRLFSSTDRRDLLLAFVRVEAPIVRLRSAS